MIGIDTNLLVRYITQDGDEAPAVSRHLESHCTQENPGFICIIVLCELVWVLRQGYKYDKASVSAILEKLLTAAEFEVERPSLAWMALGDYRSGSADYSDYLIAQLNHEYGAVPVHTLDTKAAKSRAFTLVDTAK